MKFAMRNGRRVIVGKKNHVPAERGAIRFGSDQDTRMECVEHGAVAEQECERLCFVAAGDVYVELSGCVEYGFLQCGFDARVPVQDARDGRDTYVREFCDFSQADFVSFGIFCHLEIL